MTNDTRPMQSFVNDGAFTEHYRVFSDCGMSNGIYCSIENARLEAARIIKKNGWAVILKTIEGVIDRNGVAEPLKMEPWE